MHLIWLLKAPKLLFKKLFLELQSQSTYLEDTNTVKTGEHVTTDLLRDISPQIDGQSKSWVVSFDKIPQFFTAFELEDT